MFNRSLFTIIMESASRNSIMGRTIMSVDPDQETTRCVPIGDGLEVPIYRWENSYWIRFIREAMPPPGEGIGRLASLRQSGPRLLPKALDRPFSSFQEAHRAAVRYASKCRPSSRIART